MKANGQGVDFNRADLSYADFSHADVSHAIFNNAILVGANLHRTNDLHAVWSGADLSGLRKTDPQLVKAEDWKPPADI
jgi:uncharacterized protein YjbI with pentapeptide repeats